MSARVAVILFALLATATADAQRTTATFRLLVDGPTRIGSGLKRAADDGFTCAAVAQPVAPFLARNVAVIVGRRADRPSGAVDGIEVVVPQNTNIDAFEEAVNRTAANGFA